MIEQRNRKSDMAAQEICSTARNANVTVEASLAAISNVPEFNKNGAL
jgi:hypothetical protein